MKQGILICFSGIDGSGKTTLIKELIKDLKAKGIQAEYRWGKFESSLLRLLILIKNKLLLHESDLKENYERSLKLKNNLFSSNLISMLYEYFVLVNYTFQVIFKIVIPLKMGKNIVCDRYVYDTIVDLALDLRYPDGKIKHRLNQLFRLLPKPDVLFFIDVPEEVAFRRKNDIPSIEFLRNKKEVYSKILKITKMDKNIVSVINGTNSVHNLKKEVTMLIGNCLRDE